MKKILFRILGATIALLLVVVVAFAIKTGKEKNGNLGRPVGESDVASVEETTAGVATGTGQSVDTMAVYKSILLDERYKKDGELGFTDDAYFLLYDVDGDGEEELLITGSIGVDSLCASMIYDYENNVLSFTSLHGELAMVVSGAVGIDGWYVEGQESDTEIYRVLPNAEIEQVSEMEFSDANWAVALYKGFDYGELDVDSFDHVYLIPIEADLVSEYCAR